MTQRINSSKSVFWIVSLLILNACAVPPPISTPVPSSIPPSSTPLPRSFGAFKIKSVALSNNIVGQDPERTINIYLPPSYNMGTNHYPVVYYLPGYSDAGIMGISFPDDLDELMAAGAIEEMILVIVPGGSSFYANSPVSGNWEDFIVQEVVGYVDEHYRTLPKAESRGISGHSMGGFGSLNIAMHHPDVFSAVYSMSPGLFDADGLWNSQMYGDFAIRKFMREQVEILSKPEDEQLKAVLTMQDFFTVAYGRAFAPNPNKPPFYFDYPYTESNGELVRDDEIWKRWESGFGGIPEEIVQYKENLLNLQGIRVDYGQQDDLTWIPQGSVYFDEELTAAGIPHLVTAYEGNHFSKLGERVSEHMLPFFSELLVGE